MEYNIHQIYNNRTIKLMVLFDYRNMGKVWGLFTRNPILWALVTPETLNPKIKFIEFEKDFTYISNNW